MACLTRTVSASKEVRSTCSQALDLRAKWESLQPVDPRPGQPPRDSQPDKWMDWAEKHMHELWLSKWVAETQRFVNHNMV